jgi:hypothetical protein
MNSAALAPSQSTFGPPVPRSEARCKQLETQITELSAHIHAATYRLMEDLYANPKTLPRKRFRANDRKRATRYPYHA